MTEKQADDNSSRDKLEKLLIHEEFSKFFHRPQNLVSSNINETLSSILSTSDPLNTTLINNDIDEQQGELSRIQQQSQTTIEASLPIHDSISAIIDHEHEFIGFHTSTPIKIPTAIRAKTLKRKSIVTMSKKPNIKSIGTMPKTPNMKSIDTMPKTRSPLQSSTPTTTPISSIVPVNETIDLCSLSSTSSTIDLEMNFDDIANEDNDELYDYTELNADEINELLHDNINIDKYGNNEEEEHTTEEMNLTEDINLAPKETTDDHS